MSVHVWPHRTTRAGRRTGLVRAARGRMSASEFFVFLAVMLASHSFTSFVNYDGMEN